MNRRTKSPPVPPMKLSHLDERLQGFVFALIRDYMRATGAAQNFGCEEFEEVVVKMIESGLVKLEITTHPDNSYDGKWLFWNGERYADQPNEYTFGGER